MIREKKAVWQTTIGLVVVAASLGVSPALAKHRPRPAQRCAGGRYVVKGRALIASDTPDGEDAVVLSIPGAAEGAAPAIAIASGCPEAPVTLETRKGGTRVRAVLTGCAGSNVTLRGRLDASCRIMRGRLHAHAGGGGTIALRHHFTAELNGGFAGRVLGTVTARHGESSFALPDMQVFLMRRADPTPSVPSVQSDDAGRFVLAADAGEYDLCASGNGFLLTCNPEPVRFGPDLPDAVARNVEIPLTGGAVHGRVLLSDGTPCYQAANPLDGGVVATVSHDGTSVKGTGSGGYLLAGLSGPGSYTLTATCGSARLSRTVELGAEELSGAKAVDLTIPNTPPRIDLLAASQNGQGVRKAAPGTVVDVAAEVVDDDGDRLRYAWIDDFGGVTSVDAPQARWTLQSVPAQNVLNLLVTDGKGGYATQQLVLRGGVPFARFTGTVREPGGTPVANATVTVGSEVTHTDGTGFFRLKVADAPAHVLTVKAPGHAPYSRPYDSDAAGLDITLEPARRFVVEAGADIDVMDGPDGSTLRVPAGALVDPDGHAAAGPLTVDIYTYDRNQGEFPGDGVAERDGRLDGMQLQTCLWLVVTDASGRRLDLAPGAHAELSFKMPATLLAERPATIPFVRFDDASGRWAEDGIARLQGDRYVAQVTHLGSAGITFFNGGACLRIQVDDNSLERPFYLKIIDSNDGSSGTVFVTQKLTPVYGLRQKTYHFLQVMPKSNPTHIITTALVYTDANVTGPASPPFPYSSCKTVTLQATLPSKSWLTRLGFGDETTAQAYYKKIGAIPAKDTFSKWLAANGFEAGFRSNDVVFFNPNEIGLGRRVNCRKTGTSAPIIACYNTKFGDVGGNVDEMLEDTADLVDPGDSVAMEFSPGGLSAERNVKYYIYGPDGKLKTKTAFDTEGYVKYVPNVCNHCHNGGTGYGPPNAPTPTEMHAKFVALDPWEYKYLPSGPYTLDNQQERFRQLNEMISYAVQHTGPPWELIDSIYPGSNGQIGVHTPGTKARPAPVPNAWRLAPDIYTKIVKPSCRTCHMNQPSTVLNFSDPNVNTFLGMGAQYVCGGGSNDMPNAMSPTLRLWRSTNPFLPDVFANYFLGGTCGGSGNKRPTITIDRPFAQSHVQYGGTNGVFFSARASDAEDGTAVSVKWLDATGAVIGYGASFTYVVPTPGPQTVRAIATDRFGSPSLAAEVSFFADNTPPLMDILRPSLSQNLVADAPFQFGAITYDPNEPFQRVPCERIVWKTNVAGDPTLTGCEPIGTFHTPGQRTFTVTATDTAGAAVTKTFPATVVQAVPPPRITISSPVTGQVYGYDEAVPLTAVVVDSSGENPVAQWSVTAPDQTYVSIGTGNTLSWTPSSILPPICHASDVGLKAEVHTSRGADVTFATITVQGAPCATPKVTITSPTVNDGVFQVDELVTLSADVVDPSQPNDTAGGQPAVRWSVKFPFNGPEVPIATGNPLQWRPSDQLPLGCATGLYDVIARVSNAAGETAVSREVYIVSPENLCL